MQVDSLFIHGIELFNKREFFDCHEILEEYWKNQTEPEKELTQGIIQIAVAYYHALRDNKTGAVKLMERGLPRLRKFLQSDFPYSLDEFITAVEQDLTTLKANGKSQSLLIPELQTKN